MLDAELLKKAKRCWSGMKTRCYNPNNPAFKHYGRRGIRVCDRWLRSFDVFVADMGLPPSASHSIDRISNRGDYEPENCRWATAKEQARNRTSTVMVRFGGRRMSTSDFAELHGLSRSYVYALVVRGGLTAAQVLSDSEERKRGKAERVAREDALKSKKWGPLKGRRYKVGRCPVCKRRWHYALDADPTCPGQEWHPSGMPPWPPEPDAPGADSA